MIINSIIIICAIMMLLFISLLISGFVKKFPPICPFVPNIADALRESLPSNVTGQDAGLKSIVKAFSEWESNKKDGPTGPLVLAIVGPNGVGKSETGHSKTVKGLLILDGSEFNKDKAILTGVGQIQVEIRKRITDHLIDCEGNAMIIFDEMQNFADGSFDTLQSGLHRGGLLQMESGVTVSTENTIFLFITDTGADRFGDLIISYGNRSKIPQSVIQSAARSALVDHMGDSSIVGLIKKVIPFMPMENAQIQDLFKLKIRKLPYILNVDDSAVAYMSGPSFLNYVGISKSSSDEMVSVYKSFAELGGRAVTNELMPDLSALVQKHMPLDKDGKIRHVGFDKDTKKIILQWCERRALIRHYEIERSDLIDEVFKSTEIDQDFSTSDACESVWEEKFQKVDR